MTYHTPNFKLERPKMIDNPVEVPVRVPKKYYGFLYISNTYSDKTPRTIHEWAEIIGVKQMIVYDRIRNGNLVRV